MAHRKLPLISLEIINTFAAEITKIKNIKDQDSIAKDYITEFRGEQPFLFFLLTEVLKKEGKKDFGGMTPAIILYKLLKAQMEADLLGQSLDSPAKRH